MRLGIPEALGISHITCIQWSTTTLIWIKMLCDSRKLLKTCTDPGRERRDWCRSDQSVHGIRVGRLRCTLCSQVPVNFAGRPGSRCSGNRCISRSRSARSAATCRTLCRLLYRSMSCASCCVKRLHHVVAQGLRLRSALVGQMSTGIKDGGKHVRGVSLSEEPVASPVARPVSLSCIVSMRKPCLFNVKPCFHSIFTASSRCYRAHGHFLPDLAMK